MPLEGINLVVIREGVSLSCMFCERVLLRIPAGSIAVLKNLLVDLQCISHACKTIREWDHTTTNVDKTSYIPIDEEATEERIAEVRSETEHELDLLQAMLDRKQK